MGRFTECREENGSFVIELSGRIDYTNAPTAEKELDDLIGRIGDREYVIDVEGLEYISSAGLRVLMKLAKRNDRRVALINVSLSIYDILETTGFTELFKVTRKLRRVDVEGCRVIGKGFYGTVYRIDAETIVKVYSSPDSLSMIRSEKELARAALIAGVPTAISYDIVRVGDSYGSVFELVDAKTLHDLLAEQPGKADEIIEMYASFIKLVNSRSVPEGQLPSAKQRFLKYLGSAEAHLDRALYERLAALISAVPEQCNVVHGDAQMKNIMVGDGEPILIDMDTLSAGNPIFDLQAVYVTYFAFGEDDPNNSMQFLGVPTELSRYVWERFIGCYLGTDDAEKISQLRDKIMLLGCIRFLHIINLGTKREDNVLRERRIARTVERLAALADRVDTLML